VTGAGKIIASKYFTYIETFAVVGLVYLALVTIATWVANYLEERYRIPGMVNAGEPI
jgi:polar amino acid transport system permease protein